MKLNAISRKSQAVVGQNCENRHFLVNFLLKYADKQSFVLIVVGTLKKQQP